MRAHVVRRQAPNSHGGRVRAGRWPAAPDADEIPSFYRPYLAAAVREGEPLGQLLKDDAAAWARLLAGVPADKEGYRYAEGKWTMREVVGHVTDAERMFAARALAFARGDAGPYPSFDEAEYAAHSGAALRPLAALAEEFRAVRQATVLLFEGLDEDAWERRGVASGCEFAVRDVAWIVAGHSVHHRGVLTERYL